MQGARLSADFSRIFGFSTISGRLCLKIFVKWEEKLNLKNGLKDVKKLGALRWVMELHFNKKIIASILVFILDTFR